MANNNNDGKGGIGAGVGLAALAAAAAGAYYFYGSKHSAQHRRKMRSWALKATGEVMERMEKMKEVSKDAYDMAVNQVMDKYGKVKNIPTEELATLAKDLKGHWNRIAGHLRTPAPKKVTAKKATVKKKTK